MIKLYRRAMPCLLIRVEQTLSTTAPDDDEQLADALETIKDPEPYLNDEPFEIDFGFSVDKIEAAVDGGEIRANRILTIRFAFEEADEAATWLIDEGISEAESADDLNQVFQSIDPKRLATILVGDFEGSTIGDEMVDYEAEYSVSFEP